MQLPQDQSQGEASSPDLSDEQVGLVDTRTLIISKVHFDLEKGWKGVQCMRILTGARPLSSLV